MPALVAALVLLGVGVALAGRPSGGSRSSSEGRPGPRPAATATPGGEIPDPGRVRAGRPTVGPTAAPSTVANACEGAMRGAEMALEERRGLERAIARVRANCERNPRAQGLLRALERLGAHDRGDGGRDEAPGQGTREPAGQPRERGPRGEPRGGPRCRGPDADGAAAPRGRAEGRGGGPEEARGRRGRGAGGG